MCSGCRCRAYAASGDYLAEDPACDYQPGQFGGEKITLGADQTFGLEVKMTLDWSPASIERLNGLPSFARGMVSGGVERYAKENGIQVITPEVMQTVREAAELLRGRRFSFTEFNRTVPAMSDSEKK